MKHFFFSTRVPLLPVGGRHKTLEQERPVYRDKMNDVRFLCVGEGMAAVLNACDVVQERPACRDKMDNVRFLCNGEGVAAVVYACDVIQFRSLMGGPNGHPTLSASAIAARLL